MTNSQTPAALALALAPPGNIQPGEAEHLADVRQSLLTALGAIARGGPPCYRPPTRRISAVPLMLRIYQGPAPVKSNRRLARPASIAIGPGRNIYRRQDRLHKRPSPFTARVA